MKHGGQQHLGGRGADAIAQEQPAHRVQRFVAFRPELLQRRLQSCTSTTPTLLTPLQARKNLPSGVAIIWRTTPPPEGMGQLVKRLLCGSKWTMVLGLMPDSLYPPFPSGVMAMPYGWALEPAGEYHSFTAQLAGSRRPS